MNRRTVKVCSCSLLRMAIGCQTWSGAPSAPQIKQASVNGVTLDYQEQGKGAPVVFIHGCCTDYRTWDANARPSRRITVSLVSTCAISGQPLGRMMDRNTRNRRARTILPPSFAV